MSDLLNATLGVVGQVGEAVDKVTGGRALRGALAGKPRELASFVPFSDTMGLTNKEDATSGRDLTDHYNITRKGDNSFGSHAAGFAADMVSNPLSLIGGYGAFKAAPTVAKGIGAAAKSISGLDMLENAGGALKRFAGYGNQGAETLKASRLIPPKPVNTSALADESLAANATRPRRWSADPAERKWYAADRGRRYAERMSGREIPNGVPGGIPEFNLADEILKPARSKPDIYGFASSSDARQAAAEAQPTGHGPFVEPTASKGYAMKPGPVAGKMKPSGPAAPSAPVEPVHGPNDDLEAAYQKLTSGFRQERPLEVHEVTDAVRHAEPELHSLGEVKSMADANAARNARPGPMDLIRRMMAGGEASEVLKPARTSTTANDSLLQHVPWAGRTDISPATRNAAEWAGPGYGGGREKIQGILDAGRAAKVSPRFDTLEKALIGHPELERIASEFPEDTKFLGHGAEALAGISGSGHVIRAAPAKSWLGSSGRADIPEIVQPFRSIQIPGKSPWTIEHLPKVNPIAPGQAQRKQVLSLLAAAQSAGDTEAIRHGEAALASLSHLENESNGIGWDLSQSVRNNSPGLNPWDFRGHNVSLTGEGNAIGHDGGMAHRTDGIEIVRHSPKRPSRPPNAKAAIEGQDAVREAIEKGIASGTVGQGIGREHGVLGLPEAAQRQKLVNAYLAKYGQTSSQLPINLPGLEGFQSAPDTLAREFANAPVAPPSSQFAIHVGGNEKIAPGLLSRLMGGGPSANPSVAGGTLPWQRAVQIGNEAGFPTSMIKPGEAKSISRAQGWDMDQLKDTPAWYSAKRNKIEVNPYAATWHDSDAMAQHMLASGPDQGGWFSSSHPDHIINHETGHGMHAQSVGAERFQFDPDLNTPFTPGSNEHNFFTNTLSQYGATQPDEAIAEIVAGLKGGRELNPSLIPALKEWGGPQMFQNLGDHGLLKGLGLSLLGTLGVGGLATQQQGAQSWPDSTST